MEVQQANRSRHNWKQVLVVLTSAALIAGVVLGSIFIFRIETIKTSRVYRDVLATAKKDPRVIGAIGAPIREGLFPTGNIRNAKSSGDADLAIPVSGPTGKATIYVAAWKLVGMWRFVRVVVIIEGKGTKIDLLSRNTPQNGASSPSKTVAPVHRK